MNTAYFVKHPRVIDDLRKPHLVSSEREYRVVKRITLTAIDFENFITDLGADRQFITDNAALCTDGDPFKCLLIHRHGKGVGILVIPEDGSFVGWAAYFEAEHL